MHRSLRSALWEVVDENVGFGLGLGLGLEMQPPVYDVICQLPGY